MDINITNPVTASKIGEVVNASASATPNDTDLVPIVESSVTKKLTLTNLKAFLKTYFDTLYSALTASSFGTFINGLTSKTTPVDADQLVISDSAAANVAKKVTGTNFKAFLKTYFDTIYQAAGSYLTSANITQTITNGVTDKAPSEDAVFDALALKQDYCLFTHNPSGVINPADGQYYYFGMPNITATNTTSATGTYIRELASPVTGVIEKAVLTIYCGNYATVNSDLSSWIIKNTTNSNTNYTLSSSVNYSTANLIQKIDVTGLSIPVTRGDLLMTLIGNATWATVNPTSVYWVAQYLVRKTS